MSVVVAAIVAMMLVSITACALVVLMALHVMQQSKRPAAASVPDGLSLRQRPPANP